MASLGTNIKLDGSIPVDDLAELGVGCVRVVAKAEFNLSGYFAALADSGIRVWLVLARESFNGFGAMGEDGQPTLETLAAGMAEYRQRYAGQIARYEVGNEPDHESDSSWALPHTYFERLLFTARDTFGPDEYLVAGGLAGGNPDWLSGLDAQDPPGLNWVNAIAIHPYARGPRRGFPFVPAAYLGRVTELLEAYRQWLDTHGRPDKELHVSEWGAPVGDFTANGRARTRPDNPGDFVRDVRGLPPAAADERTDEAMAGHAMYIRNMAATFRELESVGDAIQFCYSDNPGGFGLTDNALEHLPAWDAMQQSVVA